jgi:hypothetical protein
MPVCVEGGWVGYKAIISGRNSQLDDLELNKIGTIAVIDEYNDVAIVSILNIGYCRIVLCELRAVKSKKNHHDDTETAKCRRNCRGCHPALDDKCRRPT